MARSQRPAATKRLHSARRKDATSPGGPDHPDGSEDSALQAAVDILKGQGWESVTPANVSLATGVERSEIAARWADRNALVRDAVRSVALTSAGELLTSEGWDSVTQARVAEHCGLGRATIYRYWPKREDLVHDAVVAHMAIRTHIEPTGHLEPDLVEELHRLASELKDRSLDTVLAAIIDRAEFDEDQRKLKLQMHASGNAVLRSILEAAAARGELRVGVDVEICVSMLIGPLVYRGLVSEEKLDRKFIEWLVRSFLEANRTPNARRRSTAATRA